MNEIVLLPFNQNRKEFNLFSNMPPNGVNKQRRQPIQFSNRHRHRNTMLSPQECLSYRTFDKDAVSSSVFTTIVKDGCVNNVFVVILPHKCCAMHSLLCSAPTTINFTCGRKSKIPTAEILACVYTTILSSHRMLISVNKEIIDSS